MCSIYNILFRVNIRNDEETYTKIYIYFKNFKIFFVLVIELFKNRLIVNLNFKGFYLFIF